MSNESKSDRSKTRTYSNSDDTNKTQSYESDSGKTQTYKEYEPSKGKTVGYDVGETQLTNRTKEHNLGVGDSIELNDERFQILEIISGEEQTGEAVIYKIKDQQEKVFALKLYYQFRDAKNEPNPEALKRIKAINDFDILKLYHYGTGANKWQNKFCYEICDFAEGGNLLQVPDLKQKYTPEFLESNVIPEIFKGIQRLHQHRIYHCDLKPQNVFYLDKDQTDLVIGDYGSAKTFEESSQKKLRLTDIIKATKVYISPELKEGIISEANDYYSFGIIILHLLYPQLLSDELYESTRRKIIERRNAGQPIIDYEPQYERFNQLIAGLTLQDISRRWGKEEIERWMQKESVEVRYRTDAATIKLGKATIVSESDLIEFIEKDNNWYQELIEDQVGYDSLLKWLSSVQDHERRKIFDRMVRYYQQEGRAAKDFVKEAILRYFNPQRPVNVEMKSYNFFSANNLNQLIQQFFKHLDDIWKITDLGKLKFYLFQFEFSLRSLEKSVDGNLRTRIKAILDKISSVINIALTEDFSDYQAVFYAKITDEKLLELFYAFDQNRVFRDLSNNSHDTIEKLGFLFAKHPELFKNKHIIVERKVFLNKLNMNNLLNLSYGDFLFEIFNDHIKSEINFCAIAFNQPDKGDCTIQYKMGKSLSEFFSDNSIKNELVEISNVDEKLILKRTTIFSTNKIYSKFISEIESKHRINEQLINKQSKLQFKNAIRSNLQIYRRNQTKFKIKQVINFIDFPFFIKSFSFLLPIACFILIMIASNNNNHQVRNFLSNLLSIFNIEIDNFDESFISGAYVVNFLFLISFLPSIILAWKDIARAYNEDILGDLEVFGRLLIVFLIASPIIGLILGVAIFIVIGIVGGIIAIISNVTWNEVENFMEGLFIFLYVGTGIIILLGSVLTLFVSQKKFKLFPFLISIFLIILLSVIFFSKKNDLPSEITNKPKVEKSIQNAIITVRSANIRSGPSSDYQVVDNAKSGETVEIISKSGNWYLIRHNGKEGYIYNSLININNK